MITNLKVIYVSNRWFSSVQFSWVAQSCPTLCDPMNRSMTGLPVHHHLLEFTQTHVHQVRDAIKPSHPRSSPSPPAPNPSQHQCLFQRVNSSHEVWHPNPTAIYLLALILQFHTLPSSDFGLMVSCFEMSLPSLFGLFDEIWWDEDIF